MTSKEEIELESKKISLIFGLFMGLGIVVLISSTLLQMADIFSNTPSLVFKLVNGFSIAVIIICGLIWSQMDKKMRLKSTPD